MKSEEISEEISGSNCRTDIWWYTQRSFFKENGQIIIKRISENLSRSDHGGGIELAKNGPTSCFCGQHGQSCQYSRLRSSAIRKITSAKSQINKNVINIHINILKKLMYLNIFSNIIFSIKEINNNLLLKMLL